MLYENYRNKVRKCLKIFDVIHKFRYLIIGVLTVIIAAIVAGCVFKGSIVGKDECPAEIFYGQKLDYSVNAMFSSVSYDYREEGSSNWSSEEPYLTGKYEVRAVTKNFFDGARYGKVHKYAIYPYSVNLMIAETEITYGDPLTVNAELVLNDTLSCDKFIFEKKDENTLSVKIDVGSVKIYNERNVDRTSQYRLNASGKELTFSKRETVIDIADATFVYDGEVHWSEEYSFSVGGPAYNDNATVVFDESSKLTNVGEVENNATFAMFDENGNDVTEFYALTVITGNLVVEKRKITLSGKDVEFEYDGKEHYDDSFDIDEETPVVEGHNLKVIGYDEFVNAGEYSNELKFGVYDENGDDVSGNYEFDLNAGTLKINKRLLKITTKNGEFVYDGQKHAVEEYEITEGTLVSGHEISVSVKTEPVAVGEYDNDLTFVIMSGKEDATENYDIEKTNGVIDITPRPVTILTGSAEKEYDGTPLICEEYTITSGSFIGWYNLELTFTGSRTNVGKSENTADVVKCTDENGEGNYDITIECGWLTVTPRYIFLRTKSAEKIYDDKPLVCKNYEIIETWDRAGLVIGHRITEADIEYFGTITDVGSAKNEAKINGVIRVSDENGNDVSENYVFEISEYGTLTVYPRPIIIKTSSGTWMYDDEYHSTTKDKTIEEVLPNDESLTKGLCDGHRVDFDHSAKVKFVSDSGTYNAVYLKNGDEGVEIYNAYGRNVTKNYNYAFEYGTLTITARPITVYTYSAEKTYNAKPITIADRTSEWKNKYGDKKFAAEATEKTNPQYSPLVKSHELILKGYNEPIDVSESGTYENTIETYAIVNGNGEDRTENYTVKFVYGTLIINPNEIRYSTESAEKIFDGEILTAKWKCEKLGGSKLFESHKKYNRISYGISDGITHYFDVELTSELLFPGEIKNEDILICKITDQSGNEVLPRNYKFVAESIGTLKITKRGITITTGSRTFEYDGKYHSYNVGNKYTDNKSNYDSGLIVAPKSGNREHAISITCKEFKNVGKHENKATVKITRRDDNFDLTEGYEITFNLGTITITPRYIEITTASNVWAYDGNDHYDDNFEVVSSKGLCDGHTARANKYNPSIRYPGAIANELEVHIYDEDGIDVTSNYVIKLNAGTLEVRKSVITVRTDSAWKYYDGTPLTKHSWRVISVVSADGEITNAGESNLKFDITVTGEITEVGETDNVANFVAVHEDDGTDVTDKGYCDIVLKFGVLSVVERRDPEKDVPPLDDGGDIGLPPPGGSPIEKTAAEIKSDTDGTVYLRFMSFGDYTGKKWLQASEYGKTIDGYSLNYLISMILGELGYQPHAADIKVYGNYLLPYFTAKDIGNYSVQTSDVRYDGEVPAEYALAYYIFNYLKDGKTINTDSVSAYLKNYEKEYGEFVRKNYLGVPTSTRTYLQKIIEAEGFTSSYADIERIAKYIQNSAEYNLLYDRNLDKEDDIVVAFLRDYKSGICQHYASAATMLFRTLGVPARYTIGYVGETKAGEWAQISAANAHAWVEVYIDGLGWVPIEVTGSSLGGLPIPSEPTEPDIPELPDEGLIICPIDVDKEYDGTPLYAQNILKETKGLKKLLNAGFTYEVEVSGSRTEIGESPSKITYIKIYDADGVDVTDKLEMTIKDGSIRITNKQIFVHLYELKKYYDGLPLSYEEDDYWVENLPEGYTLSFKLSGRVTEVTDYFDFETLRDLPVKITDKNGKDVTQNYYVKFVGKQLEVMKNRIVVTTNSAEKKYDDKELSSPVAWVSLGYLAKGHSLKVVAKTELTEKGSCQNILAVIVVDQRGKDVSDNYDIEYKFGTLTVS